MSLIEFDKKSVESLPKICRDNIPAIAEDLANWIAAEVEVPGASISSISIRRLIVAVNAVTYYDSIDRVMTQENMHYSNVLSDFKIEYESFCDAKKQDKLKLPMVNDRDNDRKVLKLVLVFNDYLTRVYGSWGPIAYVIRKDVAVPTEVADPLKPDKYFGESGCLVEELITHLPQTCPIYKNDNATVFSKIEQAVRGTSIESTIKYFSRKIDGRKTYEAMITNHAGDSKHRAILKQRMNVLQNVKWNGRYYPLETHVTNHRQAIDNLTECSNHIIVSVPDKDQRVEYLIDSITCSDNAIQASIGFFRANTNSMREDFELAANALIEVDPYKRSQRNI